MAFFGLGKKTRRAVSDIKKFEKRDLAQAVVNAAYLVAYADGECGSAEKTKIDQLLRVNPVLSNFASELGEISNRIVSALDADFKVGRRQALREIEDVKGDVRECEDVMDVACAVARADGSVEPDEVAVLEDIAALLGLRLDQHL
jgi:tellurite resistance protein TerB